MGTIREFKQLEAILRQSPIVRGGFLGHDHRSIEEILQSDMEHVMQSGYSMDRIVSRMRELTELGKQRLGGCAAINQVLSIRCEEYKGWIECPWGDQKNLDKRVTTALRSDLNTSIQWTDLNIHLIEKHGFFEGRGSTFRIEPLELVQIIF
jgi:hypothetical protein